MAMIRGRFGELQLFTQRGRSHLVQCNPEGYFEGFQVGAAGLAVLGKDPAQ